MSLRKKQQQQKKTKKQKVGAVGFDSLRNVYIYTYIFFFTKVTVSNRKTAHLSSAFLHFSRNTDIEGPDGCLDIALKFLTAKIVYSTLSLSLC